MSSRILIPMLCVGAVAFACGPRTHNEASAPTKTGSAVALASNNVPMAPQQQGAPRATTSKKQTAISARLYVRANEQPILLALQVVNSGKKRVELTFPSGQTYDFVVLDSSGREVWRWASGRMFTQTLRNKLLAGGASLDLEEELESSALPPGRYTARAILTSENYPFVEQTEFTIQGTAVASR